MIVTFPCSQCEMRVELKHDRFDQSTIEVELLSLVKMLDSKCDHCIEIIRSECTILKSIVLC